ncbi:hypothetical protein SLS53_002322 [Cytospora paraplurivora]|uniref:Uncharacterized protein n=1 Tax=Cytospora paraplurivora TaxID=2898453 RepID=A0AAN9UND0_9PEZI
MVGKAPSEGTKVNLGENAPVVREGAGAVASESLAAESFREGGEFSKNRNISEIDSNTTAHHSSKAPSSAPAPAESHAETAPSYVNTQNIRDSAGPHGKNITEDPELIGRPAKFNVEPGSKDDPARLAEQKLAAKQATAPGAGQGQADAGNTQPYDALDNETSA